MISELEIPTHNQGNMLDLSFATNSLVAAGVKFSIPREFDVTSDYKPLLISFPVERQNAYPVPKPRLATIDEKISETLLGTQLIDLAPL